MTVQIRLNNTYVKYDDYLKSYINITASNSVEDLMKRPFKKTESRFKSFRLCTNQDYERIGVTNYVEGVINATK